MSVVVPGPVLDQVRDRLAREEAGLTPDAVARALRQQGRPVGDAEVLAVHAALVRDALGAGALEPLLAIPGVTDVLVNGPEAVWFDRGDGLERAEVAFTGEAEVRALAQRLVAAAGRRLDDAMPYADVRLRDGTRLHAVLAPLARPGTLISLRLPGSRCWDLDQLERAGTVHPVARRVLEAMLIRRRAFLISGGTGSGKTTLLGSLLGAIDPAERIVVVEDSSELRPAHPHVVALEARPANLEGAGAVDLRTLVRQALRMRPDRVVVGEVRGAEVVDLLAALNTGHAGGCGTVHANGVAEVPARVESLALTAGLSRDAIHSQMAAALDLVLHVARGVDGHRRLAEVGVLAVSGERVVVRSALRFAPGAVTEGPGVDRLGELIAG